MTEETMQTAQCSEEVTPSVEMNTETPTKTTAESTTKTTAESTAESVQPDITHRLAVDFLRLCEEFPAVKSPDELPDAVLDTAVTENISLLDAYLRFRWQEEKRVLAEAERSRQAAERSVGSLLQHGRQAKPEQEAFMRGLRRALK